LEKGCFTKKRWNTFKTWRSNYHCRYSK